MTMGEKIRMYREIKGMSQEALALAVGYKNKGSISLIENGHCDIYQDKIVAIATALDVAPAMLLDDAPIENLNIDEQRLVRAYRALTPAWRQVINSTIENALKKE